MLAGKPEERMNGYWAVGSEFTTLTRKRREDEKEKNVPPSALLQLRPWPIVACLDTTRGQRSLHQTQDRAISTCRKVPA